ncbi:MAG: UbiA family prenyltransferase [Methanobrevibacter sp.]|nr:UbiA family prenyltransferase [Methanobrevibacter sp.]
MNAYLEILRPGNAIMAVIAVILIAIIAKNYNLPIILCALAVFIVTGGGNVINDYFDYKIDAINKPSRPIPSGRISLKNAYTYASLLFITAIILGITISYLIDNFIPALIIALSSLLMYYYAHTLKKIALIGNIAVSLLTGLCFIFAGIIIAYDGDIVSLKIVAISAYIGFFAFLMTMAREITKDMEDIEGDKVEKARTFPIKYGLKISSYLATSLMILAIVLSPLLYIYNIFNIYYILILLIGIIMFLYGVYKILKDQNPETCAKVSKFIKIGMMIVFIAFTIGSISF